MVDFRAQIVVVKKYLALIAAQTKVILCSGNHDLGERNAEGEKISRWISEVRDLGIACDGDNLTIGDTLFSVCPWWDGPLVKQRIADQLRDASLNRPQRWIWAHHAPPANSPTSWGGKRFFGDVELVQWIMQYQPSTVISAMCINPPSSRMARGSTDWARRGCSMPACNPDGHRRTSCWTWMRTRHSGWRRARRSGLISTRR